MKYTIALLLLLSGCFQGGKSGLELVPEGAPRAYWKASGELSDTKNTANMLLNMAKEKFYNTNTMDKVLQINQNTVACTDALPLSDKRNMKAFTDRMHSANKTEPDSYFIQKLADFYQSASECYRQHNTALNKILQL